MLIHCLQTRRKGTSFTRNERRTTHERIAGRFITLKQLRRAPRSPLWKSIKRSEPLMILAVIQLRVATNRNPAEGPARNRTRARVLRISVCCSMWSAIWFLLWNTGLHRVSNAQTITESNSRSKTHKKPHASVSPSCRSPCWGDISRLYLGEEGKGRWSQRWWFPSYHWFKKARSP